MHIPSRCTGTVRKNNKTVRHYSEVLGLSPDDGLQQSPTISPVFRMMISAAVCTIFSVRLSKKKHCVEHVFFERHEKLTLFLETCATLFFYHDRSVTNEGLICI